MTSRWIAHHASVLDALASMPDNSFDAILTDVPYGLGSHQPTGEELVAYLLGSELRTGGDFMGKDWHVPSVGTWRELLRVLKPGGYVLTFAGPRTVDLISIGMRAAGFEVRDVITFAWWFGQGFPKSLDASKGIDDMYLRRWLNERPLEKSWYTAASKWLSGARRGGHAREHAESLQEAIERAAGTWREVLGPDPNWRKAVHSEAIYSGGQHRPTHLSAAGTELAATFEGHGTALKPAFEPVILGRKPLDGTLAENIERWGVGTLAIDASRIATDWSDRPDSWKRSGHSKKPEAEKIAAPAGTGINCHKGGRWPANVVLDEGAAAALDEQSGQLPSGLAVNRNRSGTAPNKVYGKRRAPTVDAGFGDSGGASRFFYVAKASRAERELGCDDLPLRSAAEVTDSQEDSARLDSPRTGAGRTSGARNHHPTVKPIAFDEWLASLPLPPAGRPHGPRRIFIPYAGSGSEMIGALRAGWDEVIGVERDAEFIEILRARVAFAEANPRAYDRFRPTPKSKRSTTRRPKSKRKPAVVVPLFQQLDMFGSPA